MNALKPFSSGSGGGFSPLDLSPTAWYRADLGVTGTSSVTKWEEQSGNGHDLVPGTEPELVASGINGKPTIKFVAASFEYLEVTSGSIIVPETQIWIVFKLNVVTSGVGMIDAHSGAQLAVIKPGASGEFNMRAGIDTLTATGTISAGVATYGYAFFSTATSDAIKLAEEDEVTGTIAAASGTGLRVGARGGSVSNFADIEYADILILPSKASVANAAQIVSYYSRYGF